MREQVANAIGHRDYSIWGAVIRLFIFDRRLEVRSPGKLPNTMTVERMKIDVSYQKNPTFAALRLCVRHFLSGLG